MVSVYIEMPSGATSKPHEFLEEVPAVNLFQRFVQQMQPWKKFRADVVLMENGTQVTRTEVDNA